MLSGLKTTENYCKKYLIWAHCLNLLGERRSIINKTFFLFNWPILKLDSSDEDSWNTGVALSETCQWLLQWERNWIFPFLLRSVFLMSQTQKFNAIRDRVFPSMKCLGPSSMKTSELSKAISQAHEYIFRRMNEITCFYKFQMYLKKIKARLRKCKRIVQWYRLKTQIIFFAWSNIIYRHQGFPAPFSQKNSMVFFLLFSIFLLMWLK